MCLKPRCVEWSEKRCDNDCMVFFVWNLNHIKYWNAVVPGVFRDGIMRVFEEYCDLEFVLSHLFQQHPSTVQNARCIHYNVKVLDLRPSLATFLPRSGMHNAHMLWSFA